MKVSTFIKNLQDLADTEPTDIPLEQKEVVPSNYKKLYKLLNKVAKNHTEMMMKEVIEHTTGRGCTDFTKKCVCVTTMSPELKSLLDSTPEKAVEDTCVAIDNYNALHKAFQGMQI